MHILIFPYAQKLNNGKNNPKNYPYWKELLKLLFDLNHTITQVGVDGEQQLVSDFRKNLPLIELAKLVKQCDTWIGVDSFGQHFCWDQNKPGIVLWGQSDPKIYGHDIHINLLKGQEYLMPDQFLMWEMIEYKTECFVTPQEVIKYL